MTHHEMAVVAARRRLKSYSYMKPQQNCGLGSAPDCFFGIFEVDVLADDPFDNIGMVGNTIEISERMRIENERKTPGFMDQILLHHSRQRIATLRPRLRSPDWM